MFYQVKANLFFTESDEANDFFHDCQVALPKCSVVNPGDPNQEPSKIELILCHHDDNPNIPCEELASETNDPD